MVPALNAARESLRRVTPAAPCPICKRPDWCGVSADGHVAVCMRTESAATTKNGGWLHHLIEPVPLPPRPAKRVVAPKNWTAEVERCVKQLDDESRRKLAASLNLPVSALAALPLVGLRADDPAGSCFTFAELNPAGTVIGICRRWPKGKGPGGRDKMLMVGGHRGLTLPVGWRDRAGPVYVVEGPTDALAMTEAGLACIGRPSNSGGAELLAELLRDLPEDRDIVIVGENDRKPDGQWPGRTGASSVARRLAEELARRVRWALPPEGTKDARDWLTEQAAGAAEVEDWPRYGRDFAALLAASATTVQPPATLTGNSRDSRDGFRGESATQKGWGPPSPLPEMPHAPPFPLSLFPAKLADYWAASAESLSVPVDYIGVPALPLLGGAVGRSRAAAVKRTYAEPPLLWTAVVAPPGRAKSPSLKLARGPLTALTRKWRGEHQKAAVTFAAEFAKYEAALAKWKKSAAGEPPQKPERPTLKQLVIDKFTTESLVRINADNPRGIVLAQDELAGLVTGLGQFKGGKGDDKQTLLSLWAGAEVEVNRVRDKDGGGLPLYIPNSFVGVAGMIQPDLLGLLRGDLGRAEFVNDGWADRFLLSFPEPLPLVGEKWATVSERLERGYGEVCESLLGFEMRAETDESGATHHRPHHLTFGRDAEAAWQSFTDHVAEQANALDRSDPYAGVLSKLKHYGLRLTALVYCLRAACGEVRDGSPVDGETVRRAAALVDYFEAHGRRCLGIGWADRTVRIASRLLAWLSRNPDRTGFNRTEAFLAVKDRRDVRSSEALNPAFRVLVDHGYLRPLDRPENVKPGPVPETYTVNPAWVRDCPE